MVFTEVRDPISGNTKSPSNMRPAHIGYFKQLLMSGRERLRGVELRISSVRSSTTDSHLLNK